MIESDKDSGPILARDIIRLEEQRVAALLHKDMAGLRDMLSDDLIHIHGTGRIEDKAAYLKSVEERLIFKAISRHDLTVRIFGDIAIMTGPIDQTLHYRDSDQVNEMRAVTTQIWRAEEDRWRLVSFHASKRA
ncbi:nuclear transport factor 2 family protein [Sphingobium subterraneum]|uniref:Ketosteroid isomerase-like protein n=1 Tax=Sphingobium subterraneum TaxID=627688 RepID=A0A841JAT1_9SPHN|nr:nuclear transport factor 2 family protein [Sphingobium subterraneum]MBB6125241.1 ketosteroid isomerase-like protein [Sphingobium subterraneum]